MRLSSILVALSSAAATTAALAAPAPEPVTVNLTAASGDGHPYAALLDRIEASKNRLDASGSDITGTPLPKIVNEFSGTVGIGTPAAKLQSCSPDLWVLSSQCTSIYCSTAPRVFDPTLSSTFQKGNVSTDDKYVDGTETIGTNAFDTVTVGSFALKQAEFTLVQSYTPASSQSANAIDGILGLSFPIDSTKTHYNQPVITSMINSGVVTNPQFGYYVAPGDQSATMTFGGYNDQLFSDPTATPIWLPVATSIANVTASGAWAVSASSFKVGNGSPVTFTASTIAIMDTGTSLALLPQAAYNALSAYPGSSPVPVSSGVVLYQVSCTPPSNAPALSFFFGSVNLTITADEYVVNLGQSNGQSVCILGFQPTKADALLLGNTFLKRFYTVFDYGKKQVGFAVGKGRKPITSASSASSKVSSLTAIVATIIAFAVWAF
ncbi:aspartic peptidase domain-containing protein [Zopfochytrium polystomum]|nr:aspartic peptidase domain-containing protein [Zopfochytrium polystomum]